MIRSNTCDYTNLLAPVERNDFKSVISEHMLCIKFMSTCEIVLRRMPQNTFDVKAWSCQ